MISFDVLENSQSFGITTDQNRDLLQRKRIRLRFHRPQTAIGSLEITGQECRDLNPPQPRQVVQNGRRVQFSSILSEVIPTKKLDDLMAKGVVNGNKNG